MTQADAQHGMPGHDAPGTLTSLSAVVGQVIHVAQADYVSLRKVVEQVGGASFAPVLLLPAVAVATPLSGIPLFSSLMGIVICLVSLQMVLGKRHLWLPGWALQREVKGVTVCKAFSRLYPVARWVDARTNRRFRIFVHQPFVIIPQLICVLSGAFMPLLEFIPFSSSVMGIGVAFLALGILARDGLIVILGMVPYAAVGWLIWTAAT